MFSLSVHGVTKVVSADVNSSSDVLKSGWVTLQVATRDDTYSKNSGETQQSITLFFENLEEGLSSFMEEMITAHDDWKQEQAAIEFAKRLENDLL